MGEGSGAQSPPEKDKNYVSAVVYLGDEAGCAEGFLTALCDALSGRFENYELVFVEDNCRDGADGEARAVLAGRAEPPPATMVHLSLKQGLELAMNAGLDMAVGDFVFEFDTMRTPYPPEMILNAYNACLEGNDIVSVAPAKSRKFSSGLFYGLFNRAAKPRYPLRTDVFRLLSRRAVNRVHSISQSMPYRKAAYAASGLKMTTLEYTGEAGGGTETMRFSRAVDSLVLYTNAAYRVSLGIAFFMLALMLAAGVYIVVVWLGVAVNPVRGWPTVMLMLTGGFFGVFLLLAIVLKYLNILVELVFKKQTYLVESVEKLKWPAGDKAGGKTG
jgi:dolichol-phosphate mannosyltransferase